MVLEVNGTKAIFGLLPVWSGKIVYKGREIQNRSPIQNVHDGLTFCPQGNRVFDELTVEENLEIGGYLYRQRTLLEARKQEIFELFPILKERRSQLAGLLSGGEKQMLALGRALMLKPTLLLLDEPLTGTLSKLSKEGLALREGDQPPVGYHLSHRGAEGP
jgi:branched-chain amino acid transport system ATP-binding protein